MLSRRGKSDEAAIEAVRGAAVPLRGEAGDWDALLALVGDARLVLLGEATHGTHEFYRARAEITRRLIVEKGFTAVAVEADWPDAYRVNRYVRGAGSDGAAEEALGGFKRFPQWMWRNTDIVELVDWLRAHNDALPAGAPRVGFYGLDLYSMFASIQAVIQYLDRVDPEAGRRARQRYGCFHRAGGEDPQAYGYAAELGITQACEEEAVRQLHELRERAAQADVGGAVADDEHFYAEQNARLVKNAEEYYRSMFAARVSSWNLRDCHMADTLDALVRHFEGKGIAPKVVVWEHNSHLGDASATEMGEEGEWNVGQLVRERHGDDARLIGFSTYTGTVTAASEWDAPAERKRVRPGMAGSYEALFHDAGIPDFFLPLRGGGPAADALRQTRLERAIGVIYLPASERWSHYFHARLADQFDAVIHYDHTRALHPLERTPQWESGEPPETFPSGL
ncbi:MAG TPA: erythromycin esterase family protein [Longimicrobiaceae bacterium]|nr:erythromycin esterase family protein [Longimicrobiaceae bacterium]